MTTAIERLVAVETKQDNTDARLERIEAKLDQLLQRPSGLSTGGQATLSTVIATAIAAAAQALGHGKLGP